MVQFEQIEKVICDYFQIPVERLHKKTRKKEVIEARQLCHYFACKLTKSNNTTIGDYFGKLDHSTVSHSEKTIQNIYDTNKELRIVVNELNELFDVIKEGNIKRAERQKNIDRMNDAILLIDELPLSELIKLLNTISQKILEKYK